MREARIRADQLNSGDVRATSMRAHEREEWAVAVSLAREQGLPLVSAMREWARASELTGGNVIAAAEAWAQRSDAGAKRLTVGEAIELYLKAQRANGINTRAGVERTLCVRREAVGRLSFRARFGNHYLTEVTANMLSEWLESQGSAVSRNSHRKRVVSLFRWCRKRGYLPSDVQTAPERTDRARERVGTIGTITAAQLGQLFTIIRRDHPHYLAALALAAFCGLRRAEVHGQRWEDMELDRGFLRVTEGKPGTPARRQVPLCDTALAWLSQHAQPTGLVCENLALDRVRDIAQGAGLRLAKNGFRHTWISARVELTGDIPRTALEAGTSVRVMHRHYRELLCPEEAQAWFAVRPARRRRG